MIWSDTVVFPCFIGWWWLIPIICIILCMFACRVFGHHMTGRRWCCGGDDHSEEIKELRKEIQDLKEQLSSKK